MTNLNYKLRATINGVSTDYPVVFNDALNNVFNLRKRRIRDVGNQIGPCNSNSLSEYLTKGVVFNIDDNNSYPIVPKTGLNIGDFSNKHYLGDTFTGVSGNIKKIHLCCERIIRDSDKTFMTENINTLFPSVLIGQNISGTLTEDNLEPIALDDDGETLYCVKSYYQAETDIKVKKIQLNDTRWGLNGVEGDTAYSRGQKFANKYRTIDSTIISGLDINHGYTYNDDALRDLFEVDRQTESATFGQETISYDTWNCLIYARNDFYGTSNGTSITHDKDYIYITEYLLAGTVRLGAYNNRYYPYADYPFRPSNCQYYFNQTTRKIEGLTSVQLTPILNFVVIDKQTLEVVSNTTLEISFGAAQSATYTTIDLTDWTYVAFTEAGDEIIDFTSYIPENRILTNKYPCRLFSICANGDKVYFTTGMSSNSTELWDANRNYLINPPSVGILLLRKVNTPDIDDFCHTINRGNLFKKASIMSDYVDNFGILFNESTGIVNWYGFIDWLISAEVTLDITISASDTIKFELIEDIENEE